ncbi:TonB-dependent receptor domain-containing protein [Pseudoalteromonas arctica]|uniref:TonB-dependent receptor n=1 Tax=Pseudoalteromonas arctica TaxID=394751 RepID=A0A7Y0DQD3_9GAMM|nr:TonB-dependent receptor [Pseudoalteromonas arctica]
MKKINTILWSLPFITTMTATVHAATEENTLAIERITVQGEKTSRSIQETASSVLALTEQELRNMPGLNSTNNLLDKIPNLVTVEPGNEAPTVRGVDGTGPASGANAFFAGTRPRLNYQVDGRTLGFNESLFQNSSLWDVQQVEVYRGPQSTLQGRNSVAGAVIITTADPTFYWQGKVRAMVGGQDKRVGSIALSGPLIDDVLAFRLAYDNQSSETAVKFSPYAEENEPNRYESEVIRGKLLFSPNDDMRSILTLGRTDGKAPQSERVVRPFSEREAEFPNQPTFRSINTYGIWDTNWLISDQMEFDLNISRTDFSTKRHALTGQGNLTLDGKETVIQPLLRITSQDQRLSGFIAAYIFRTDQDEYIDLFAGGTFRDETQSDAVFAELTWQFNDAVDLTLGARYEEEDRYRVGGAGPLQLDFSESYREFLPKATVAWQATDEWTIGVTAGKAYNGGGAGITFAPPFEAYSYAAEFVTNYEIFTRASLLDNQLTFNSNIFYNQFDDMQLPFSLGPRATVIRNADKATTYGFESGINYALNQHNNVYLNIGLLQTEVNRYNDLTIQGKDFARAPAFSADLGVTSTPIDDLVVSANIRYTDAYYSDATNTPRGKVDAYAIANAQIAYTFNAIRFAITAENIFDSDSEVSILTGASSDTDAATLLKPRTLTASIEYSF